ncbi:MAG: carboxypeptidase-like regulatory domain-containing protein [Proteiniphilum sp.]|jgi:hypothetical protein|nr:carboxypeptidase-like regulatory domain-containing protein [Proteiniphilum sp.]MDD2938107.1 carboxypeptidase-like regulatory domain-containing protein [Proteiniphilum sp.]MDD3077114.1 carboxypeptidase-like regulatory domain-containing protein [Proteiniphilum sp.]MDD3956869.1 carboxypeptidase-like regulatory domain-containing protein [Proteiniphilum sp.]MDD4453611.1 carboxypeptidase-like regulatory domain-containing protein [Proteiniphilum sp.]
MQKVLFSILLSGLIIPMSAKIKGTVSDSSNNPIQYAKVAVYSLPDSVLINETTTDAHGEFAFTNVYSVNKMMKISVDGYKETSFRALPEQNVKLRGEAKVSEPPTLFPKLL